LIEVILALGVALYFFIRIWLGIRYKSSELLAKMGISKRSLVFIGIDLAILVAVVFQLSLPQFGRMHLGFLSETIRMFGISLFIVGALLSNWGRVVLGRNWRPAIVSEKMDSGQRLVTSGPFSIIRHPIYGGMILMGLGFELSLLNWLFLAVICIIPLLYWQAKKEEMMLEQVFPEYRQYKKNTKMFFPRVF
jgi:protein-S-isoprenylcysteine O-methyltransferase Ste14